jgi:cytochrome c-type biogenesis protein CcmH/NrfG
MRSLSLKVCAVSLLLALAGRAVAEESSSTNEQKERAIAALDQAIKADPSNSELWMHLGYACRKVEDFDRARQAFEKASSLDPKNQEALFMLGLIYEKMKQPQDALRIWKQYLSVATDPEKRDKAQNHIHRLSQ